MSNPAANGAASERQAFDALDRAISDALDRLRWMKERTELAEEKSEELEDLLKRFTGQEVDPGQMMSRLRQLEEENAVLRSRLEQGREGVERLLAKIRFLENQQ